MFANKFSHEKSRFLCNHEVDGQKYISENQKMSFTTCGCQCSQTRQYV